MTAAVKNGLLMLGVALIVTYGAKKGWFTKFGI